MKMPIGVRSSLAGILVVLALSDPGRAELTIGQAAPEIRASAWLNTNGTPSLARLRGRIAVVEFWATWCPPCRQSIPHLNQLHAQWSSKGVVIIGLTDEHKSVVKNFMKSLPINYVVGTDSQDGAHYGVSGIPHAFVIDPQGQVVWRGHPMSGLDAALAQAYQKTPPTLVSAPKLKKLEAALEGATQDFDKQAYGSALSTIERVTAAIPTTHPLYARALALMDRITDAGQSQLDQAQALIEAGNTADAVKALTRIRHDFKNHDYLGRQAGQKINEINSDPKAVAVIQAIQAEEATRAAEQTSERMLQKAEELIQSHAFAQAHAKLNHITRVYGQTQVGKQAQQRIQQMMADPKIAAAILDDRARKDCVGWLKMAHNYREANHPAHARPFYERIIQRYPKSSYAQTALKEMATLE